jgi:hypothetical protein
VTVRVIDCVPHAYVQGLGLVPVRGASLQSEQELETVVAAALVTGQNTMTVPGLDVVPDLPERELPADPPTRRIGFV